MAHTLENKVLRVQVNAKGAELSSLFDKRDGVEHLWQADPNVWGRHAPVLFPIVGQVKNGQYRVNGQVFELSQHGFARDMEFDIESRSDQHLTFRLSETPESLKKYPFHFVFKITYELDHDRLVTRYVIENPQDEPMYFSLGLHPGFTCPFHEGASFDDYQLVFAERETCDRHLFAGGLRNGEVTKNYLNDQDTIPLTHPLFDDDALIFKGLKSSSIRLVHKEGGKSLEMGLSGFPYLGIWTKPGAGAPFVCIEPWYGVADEHAFDGDYSQKEAVQKLEGNSRFSAQTFMRLA